MKSLLSLSEKHRRFNEAINRKVIPQEALKTLVTKLKSQGLKIATLNGSFDLLHAGHLYILFEAKQQADVLIVALNSDASIQKYKSLNRPIITLDNRLKMMSSLEWVDYVTYFDETDPRAILELIKPDVHVNGAEYGEDCIERQVVEKNGGMIYLVDRLPALSTTEVIEKIKKL